MASVCKLKNNLMGAGSPEYIVPYSIGKTKEKYGINRIELPSNKNPAISSGSGKNERNRIYDKYYHDEKGNV